MRDFYLFTGAMTTLNSSCSDGYWIDLCEFLIFQKFFQTPLCFLVSHTSLIIILPIYRKFFFTKTPSHCLGWYYKYSSYGTFNTKNSWTIYHDERCCFTFLEDGDALYYLPVISSWRTAKSYSWNYSIPVVIEAFWRGINKIIGRGLLHSHDERLYLDYDNNNTLKALTDAFGKRKRKLLKFMSTIFFYSTIILTHIIQVSNGNFSFIRLLTGITAQFGTSVQNFSSIYSTHGKLLRLFPFPILWKQ